MFSLTKWIAAPALALGLVFVGDAPDAKAQYGCYRGYGYGGGLSISVGRGYGSYYRMPYHGRIHTSHYGYRGGYFHDTSHFDYHPTEVYRHGNHYHVQPGHFDLHRTGHWHH